MTKLILMGSALLAANHFAWIDLSAIPHLGEYAKALLIALVLMPWVVKQLDS